MNNEPEGFGDCGDSARLANSECWQALEDFANLSAAFADFEGSCHCPSNYPVDSNHFAGEQLEDSLAVCCFAELAAAVAAGMKAAAANLC